MFAQPKHREETDAEICVWHSILRFNKFASLACKTLQLLADARPEEETNERLQSSLIVSTSA